MKAFISKLQYTFFEKGEFDDIKERSYEETIKFIKAFPWEQQRHQVSIGLNGPSITIEDGQGNFIKIGIDYHGKFILYLLSREGNIYCQLGNKIEDFEYSIFSFFNSGIEIKQLNKYRDWLSWSRKNFETQAFEYKFNIRRFLTVMFLPFICFVTMFLLFLSAADSLPSILISLGFNFLFFGVNWILFLNYYYKSRTKIIKISEGRDDFYFGKRGGILEKYSKKEILKIAIYSNEKWQKCPWSEFYIYEIQFTNGSMIKFCNLQLSWFKLNGKFAEQTIQGKHRFIPFMK